ncbi:helix-turn-helix transcriptional regulator [Gluconobacter sp. Dm-74]|uniref:helix-turn-helix domain-containing protein n=1 Tax=Gluconobacter sp. Dm-74 TaxID=2799803 RepID=UPI001B8B0932|nr:helix-turn-helix transcriptional regulator [Gluconobacter sp. Dm-74]
MPNLINIIARNIKRLRLERDLTIAVLAAKSRMPENLIIEIESGTYRPDPEEFLRLADALGSKPSDLLYAD